MIEIRDLLEIADAYRVASGVEAETTISYRVFGDTKRLAALREGREITVGRYNAAMVWFAANWPTGKEYPETLLAYRGPPSQTQEDAA